MILYKYISMPTRLLRQLKEPRPTIKPSVPAEKRKIREWGGWALGYSCNHVYSWIEHDWRWLKYVTCHIPDGSSTCTQSIYSSNFPASRLQSSNYRRLSPFPGRQAQMLHLQCICCMGEVGHVPAIMRRTAGFLQFLPSNMPVQNARPLVKYALPESKGKQTKTGFNY